MNKLKLGCAVVTSGNACRSREDQPEDRCMILQALAAVPARLFEAVVVVTPYPEIMRRARDFHFAALCSALPGSGIKRAVVLGLTGLRDCDGVMFLTGSLPTPGADEVAAVAEAWRANPRAFPKAEEKGPYLFPAWFYRDLLQAAL